MKRFLIIMIILLFTLAIGQYIYYKINPSNNISSLNNEKIAEETMKRLYILGESVIYDNYKPKFTFETLENKFYILVNEVIPTIYINVRNKTIEEIEQYYEQNIEQIKKMNISNKEDFIMLAYQINNVFDGENIIDLYEYNVDTDTISKSEDGLISFKVNLEYDNEKNIQILYTISEQNDSIIITSQNYLDEMFKTYTGNVSKLEVLKKIDSFISSIKDFRLNSTLKTENERRQYFDLNKEELEKIGITSQDDYVNVAIQINGMRWSKSDLQYEKYEIPSEKIINEGDYLSSELIIYYNYDSILNLKISISNAENVMPNIKISTYETE